MFLLRTTLKSRLPRQRFLCTKRLTSGNKQVTTFFKDKQLDQVDNKRVVIIREDTYLDQEKIPKGRWIFCQEDSLTTGHEKDDNYHMTHFSNTVSATLLLGISCSLPGLAKIFPLCVLAGMYHIEYRNPKPPTDASAMMSYGFFFIILVCAMGIGEPEKKNTKKELAK